MLKHFTPCSLRMSRTELLNTGPAPEVHNVTATSPCLASSSGSTQSPPAPPCTHSSYIYRNTQLLGTFCPLLPSSWSINLQMCSSSCVHPSYAPRDINSLQLFLLRVHSRPLCLHNQGLFVWQLMVHSHALVHQCWCMCINSHHLFLLKEHWGSLCKFQCMQDDRCIFSITCRQTLALLSTIMHAHVFQNSEFAASQHINSNTPLVWQECV